MAAVETAPGAIGLWLAEMGFAPPECIRDAVIEYLHGNDLSYAADLGFATDSIRRWVSQRYGWQAGEDQFRWYSGVLHATACAVMALTQPGESVVVLSPGYPPMFRLVEELGRRLIRWSLWEEQGRYHLDADALATIIDQHRPGLVILNTPHNPTGRVFTRTELQTVAEVVESTETAVVSDEIFADVVYAPAFHVPFALAAGENVAARTVTVLSASKAFNMAGMKSAVCIAGSADLMQRLTAVPSSLTGTTAVVGAVASAAAWDGGGQWLAETNARLVVNRDLVFRALGDRIPLLTGTPPEGTYLAWLRSQGALSATSDVHAAILGGAGVDLAAGEAFGDESGRRVRLCFAHSPELITSALDSIGDAFSGLTTRRP
ncbi:aminotransferase class I/II-fold pyridoxal phosphate-dependent enzyme [Actinoplanes sichuanensis]|uniref:cysteine-S-conjugate beta-lyase n=1 Tax=Actinoplanes sichuanensis TaxID=512349 RepID=A0ABW4ATA7_9ACTN|nr:aminotransferase class I/II-fold pyridoxal phosphate-dependent enzyme [Actinoplanes sichuanensis]BEL07196.1 aminotransferase class I/II-fold pyridoxal phosphate-dependent enzyme [Actinoplanes sichuanensis]